MNVLGGPIQPHAFSERMINFLKEADLGPLFSHDGEMVSDDLKDILIFLDREIVDSDGRQTVNPLYRISTSGIITFLLSIYVKFNNLTALASNNLERSPDEYDKSVFGVDDLMSKYFYNDFLKLREKTPSFRADNFKYHFLSKLVVLNADHEDDRNVEQFKTNNLNTDAQIILFWATVRSFEGTKYIPYLELASEAIGNDPTDDIGLLYDVNKPLYFIAISRNITQYLSATIKTLSQIGHENADILRERG